MNRRAFVSLAAAAPFTVRAALAAAASAPYAFVTDSTYGVVTLDVRSGSIVGRVKLSGWPRHVSLDPSGRTLWVGLGTSSKQVAVVDVSDPRHPRRLALVTPPFGAHDVGVSPDGNEVWVTAGATGETAIYHGRRLRTTLPADAAPQHVTFGGTAAYVTSGDSGTLRVHALTSGRLVRTTRIPVGSYNVQQGLGRVITPSVSRGTLSVLDARGTLLASIPVAASCHDACFAPVV